MTNWQQVFEPVRDELDNWQQLGQSARLWLRDDDAVEPSAALERLISITQGGPVPLLLCVIPERTTSELRDFLAGCDHVRVAVHGIGHHSHAPAGEKAQELGPHRPAQTVCAELVKARAKLLELYADRLSGILVPPWNRISPEVIALLPTLGFAGISNFGPVHEADHVPGLAQLNTHLDIIDWRGTRGGRDPEWLAGELAKLLRQSRENGMSPVGVLAHHLVHDELAWGFLEELFAFTTAHPAVRWCEADALIEGVQTG